MGEGLPAALASNALRSVRLIGNSVRAARGAGVLITGSTSCATTDVVSANSLIDVAIRDNRIEAQAPGGIVAQGDPANAVAGLTCSANALAIRRGPDVEVIDVTRATCGP